MRRHELICLVSLMVPSALSGACSPFANTVPTTTTSSGEVGGGGGGTGNSMAVGNGGAGTGSGSVGGQGGEACSSSCNDHDPCTDDLCVDGKCVNKPNDGLVANDDGNACTRDFCEGGTSTHIRFDQDNSKSGDETDVNCGGMCAAQCADTKGCALNSDCSSGNCENKICVSCEDGGKNGGESDVDCGAVCLTKCDNGKSCLVSTDCKSVYCVGGVCCNEQCDAECHECNAGSNGICVPTVKYGPGNGCQSGYVCNGFGECLLGDLEWCASSNQLCASSKCVDVADIASFCLRKTGDSCTRSVDCVSGLCVGGKCSNCDAMNKKCENGAACFNGGCINAVGTYCMGMHDACLTNMCSVVGGYCIPCDDVWAPCHSGLSCVNGVCQ
jgi:hypothetical protein